MTPSPSEALASLLDALCRTQDDPNAWHIRVIEGALAVGALDEASLASLGAHPVPEAAQHTMAGVLEREIRGQIQVVQRTLRGEADAPGVLTESPVVADDPAAARALHALALDAVWAREAIDRLSRVAKLGNIDAIEVPRELDDRFRESLSRWSGLRGMMLRLALDMSEHRRSSWWLSVPATSPSLEDDASVDEDDQGVARESMLRWLEARATPEGQLRLSKEEARTLLASERGRNLALELGDRMDLSALEPVEVDARSPWPL